MLAAFPKDRKPRAHFSGVGGTAMVGAARLALEAGWEVRGSDNPLYPPTSLLVEALDVPVATPYAATSLDWDPDIVVIGNALSRGNPEVEAVLTRGLHYVSLPEFVKEVVLRKRDPVVICGTHGKTTTTALTAFLLDRLGHNPGFLAGGQCLDFPHPSRLGDEGAPFVIEGDEYDTAFFDKRAKFFHYLPRTAVVTSIEFDHGDIYRDLAEIELTFERMLRQIPEDGSLLVSADCPRAGALAQKAFSQTRTFGFNEKADWRGEVAGLGDGHQQLDIYYEGQLWGSVASPLAGRHNHRNLLAAVAVAAQYGGEPGPIAEALKTFKGVRRRMELFLESNGALFIDDFAHHPTAIRETIDAVRERWPGRTVRVLFEPRSNTTVTNRFQDDIRDALRGASQVWIGPIHREESIPSEDRLDRAAVTEQLKESHVDARFTDDIDEIVADLKDTLQSGDIVLILSNGAFGGIYEELRQAFPA